MPAGRVRCSPPNVRLMGFDFGLMFVHAVALFGGLDLSGDLKMAVWLLERCRI
jgi:hypothetical protein